MYASPGDWLVAAKSEIEYSAPQLEVEGLRISTGDLVTVTISTPQTGTPTTSTGRVGDINHFDHAFAVTTADDTVERHTFGKADGTTISRLSGPMSAQRGHITEREPKSSRESDVDDGWNFMPPKRPKSAFAGRRLSILIKWSGIGG